MATVTHSKGKGDFMSTHPSPEKRQENLRRLSELMQPLYASGKNEPMTYDWLHGEKYGRPTYSEKDAIAFYSEEWEAFKAGTITLAGENQVILVIKQRDLAKAYQEQHWRDLALGVSSSNYRWDLGYFYLASAAAGLGYPDAAKAYATKAEELAADEESACAKKRLLSCSGIDVANEVKKMSR